MTKRSKLEVKFKDDKDLWLGAFIPLLPAFIGVRLIWTCLLKISGLYAYGSEGFEVLLGRMFLNGSVAQLNRALDYGSRGFRFES